MLRDKHEPEATSNRSSSSSSSDSSLSSSSTDGQGVSLSLVERPQQLSASECIPRMDTKTDFCDSFNRDTNNRDKMDTRQASLVACQEEPEHEQTLKLQPLPSSCSMEEGPLITKHADGAAVPTIKRRNVGVPKFLRFLFQILEEEDPVIITWSHEGTAFQINQPDDLATQILPKYFKHNKVSSFQRQLNYFGFKKWTKTQTNICTFSHPFFYRADKDKMKLIKRKERAHVAAASGFSAALTTTIDLESIDNTKTSHDHELAPGPTQVPFEAYDLADCPQSQLPTQQALKRQKSTTLSGATVTFLNSGAAGRRHSTGMLPGSEALGLAAAAAAAAAAASGAAPSAIADNFVLGRKRVGTPAEQEFELEIEARSHALSNSPSGPQMSMHMRKFLEHQELSQHYSYPPAHGKRQSLPHVLAPGFGNAFGIGMNNSVNGMGGGSFGTRSANILSRRRSDQARANRDNVDAALGNGCSRLENLMSSSSKSAFQQAAVLPISSELAHNADLQQQWQVRQQGGQQQQSSRVTGYGVKSHSGSEWPASMKSEASNGWLTSINTNAGSVGSSQYPTHSQNRTMPMSFLPRGSSAPSIVNPSFHGSASMDHLHTASADDRKLQLRALMSHPHDNHFHQHQLTSYQPQEEQHEKKEPQLMALHPRDYIDVLLENAGLDDGLTSQSSTMLSSELWNAHSESEARCSGSTGSFAFMQPQQNGMQQLQLSPMGDMSNQPNQRF
uniref:HSF-type DNA-binding domain-containing protein n=1 Tax=Hyaloperonospora arabidopsidis (strain Emoy2) TaxID=559515 RepID=M4BVB0_HYAAE